MKKSYNILILALIVGVAFTSCRDDSDYPEVETPGTIEIVSRELSFPAAASQGSIVVKASRPVTVTTDVEQPWMTATVEGNIVTVNVTENTSLYGRISNLTLHSGTGSTQVSVIQSGLIFDIGGVMSICSNDEKSTVVYPLKANADVSISSDVDWCHPSVVDGELIVDFDANDTGHVRRGYITYKVGSIEDELPVCQSDFDKDVAGRYILSYKDNKGNSKALYADLGRTEDNYYLDLGDGDKVPVAYDRNNATVTVKGGQYIQPFTYNNKEYYLGTVLWDTNAGYLTWIPSAGMIAALEYGMLDENTPVTLGVFEDDGGWGTYSATSIRIELFTSKTTLDGTTRAKITYLIMINPYIVRVHEDASTASVASIGPEVSVNKCSARINTLPARLMDIVPAEESVLIDDHMARIVK